MSAFIWPQVLSVCRWIFYGTWKCTWGAELCTEPPTCVIHTLCFERRPVRCGCGLKRIALMGLMIIMSLDGPGFKYVWDGPGLPEAPSVSAFRSASCAAGCLFPSMWVYQEMLQGNQVVNASILGSDVWSYTRPWCETEKYKKIRFWGPPEQGGGAMTPIIRAKLKSREDKVALHRLSVIPDWTPALNI